MQTQEVNGKWRKQLGLLDQPTNPKGTPTRDRGPSASRGAKKKKKKKKKSGMTGH